MPQQSDQPSREGERWTIYRFTDTPTGEPSQWYVTAGSAPTIHNREAVEVVPASTLQAAEAERDKQSKRAERAESLVARYRRPFPDGGTDPASRRAAIHQRMVRAELRAEAAEAREDALREGIEVAHSLCSIETGDYYAAVLGVESILRSLLSTQEPTR